jgi:hypothetical protein
MDLFLIGLKSFFDYFLYELIFVIYMFSDLVFVFDLLIR